MPPPLAALAFSFIAADIFTHFHAAIIADDAEARRDASAERQAATLHADAVTRWLTAAAATLRRQPAAPDYRHFAADTLFSARYFAAAASAMIVFTQVTLS
jgi:hypothetical protein